MTSRKQNVYSAITGYDVNGNTGAEDDFYFALETKEEKLEQIKLYAANALDIFLNDEECLDIYNAIEQEVACGSDEYHIYMSLSEMTDER